MALKLPYWATNDVTVPGTSDPNKQEPIQVQKDEGWTTTIPELQHMNWIQNNFSEWIRRNNEVKEVIDGSVLELGRTHTIGTSGVFKLPPSPEVNTSVSIMPKTGINFESLLVYIDGNTNKVTGLLHDRVQLDMPWVGYSLTWEGTYWTINLLGIQPSNGA